MPEIKPIALSDIAVAIQRLRRLRPETANALAQSMATQGQLQPIVVRPHNDHGYWLVAGFHRFEAAKQLGWQEITCTVFDHMEANEAELAEIDENLIRANLTPAEEAMHLGRRQVLSVPTRSLQPGEVQSSRLRYGMGSLRPTLGSGTSKPAACSAMVPASWMHTNKLALTPAAYSREQDQATCRFGYPPNLSWESMSRQPRRSI
jgi:hypothetical protein